MNKTLRLIWQTAINMEFQFNETDAHEMFSVLKNKDKSEYPRLNLLSWGSSLIRRKFPI